MKKITKILILTLLLSSIFIGSALAVALDGTITKHMISEPLTMFFLGTGLIVIAGFARRSIQVQEMSV
ncbi:hypothetical protein [Desulfonema ishimotonii]|uniref:hypothetical protein n=1 Tax=Desulfonema ishimotonii TaxID=45657 RepID=UPI000F56EE50|nr:hypothetical protein [Desulfonema ishimotonii]